MPVSNVAVNLLHIAEGCMELVIGHGVSVQSRRSLRQGQRERNTARPQVHINGGRHRDAKLLQHVFSLLLDGRVDTKVKCRIVIFKFAHHSTAGQAQ